MAAVRRQVAKQMYSWVLQLPLTSAVPLSWETLFWGSGVSDKAKKIFLPWSASDVKFWWAQAYLHFTPTHVCAFVVLFADGCNQGSSLNTMPNKNNIPKEKWVTIGTDKCWQDSGDACRNRVMFIDREAGKAATPQLRLCLPSANTSCSLKVCPNWPLLQENTVLFQKQIGELNLFHMGEREPFACILVGTRLQHYNVLSQRETVGAVLRCQFVHMCCCILPETSRALLWQRSTPLFASALPY